ncbi:MAG: hypothetical protein Q8O01_04190, partial [Candidatus Omnitrophota bacterium]|nr:hypothetical protein [Candidatus Omnitrophota bacterium]
LNLSLKIAYDFEPEEISSTLEKIIGKSVSLKDLSSMLAKKILEIVPKMERIDMQTASEAYRAVRQALVSL